jgi:hypothetical protein
VSTARPLTASQCTECFEAGTRCSLVIRANACDRCSHRKLSCDAFDGPASPFLLSLFFGIDKAAEHTENGAWLTRLNGARAGGVKSGLLDGELRQAYLGESMSYMHTKEGIARAMACGLVSEAKVKATYPDKLPGGAKMSTLRKLAAQMKREDGI